MYASKAMVIAETSCLGGECSKTFEVVDYDSNCQAIYWDGETHYRGDVATVRWASGGGEETVEVSEAPEAIVHSIERFIYA